MEIPVDFPPEISASLLHCTRDPFLVWCLTSNFFSSDFSEKSFSLFFYLFSFLFFSFLTILFSSFSSDFLFLFFLYIFLFFFLVTAASVCSPVVVSSLSLLVFWFFSGPLIPDLDPFDWSGVSPFFFLWSFL